jgi:hypothetical protein
MSENQQINIVTKNKISMKKFYLIATALLILSTTQNGFTQTPKMKSNLTERANIFRTSTPTPKSAKYRLDSVIYTGVEGIKTELTYDDNGNPTLGAEYRWNDGWQKIFEVEYTYDNNGNLIFEFQSSFMENRKRKKEYIYTDNGNLPTSSLRYDWWGTWPTDTTKYKYEYTYDDNGNLTLQVQHYWHGNAWAEGETREYAYNDNRNLTFNFIPIR